MVIMHLCLVGTYTDGFAYQENILPRYQKRMGHEVIMVADNRGYDYNGTLTKTKRKHYIDEYGVELYRVQPKRIINDRITETICAFRIYDILIEKKPDLIFVHDICKISTAYNEIIRYKKKINPKCVIFGDIHNDYYNTPSGVISNMSYFEKLLLPVRRCLFKYWNFRMCSRVYCIAPSSFPMAREFYHVPKEKLALLPLGYDPDILAPKDRNGIRTLIREKLHVTEDELVVVHGGKLDEAKKTAELIRGLSVIRNKYPVVRLLLFGGIAEGFKEELMNLIRENEHWIDYLGPQKQKDYYDLFLASDLAVFPGGQSSLWQEAVGCELPLLVYYRDGMTKYLDRCGNTAFFMTQDEDGIVRLLDNILALKQIPLMKKAAKRAAGYFSYERIAAKVIKDYKLQCQ